MRTVGLSRREASIPGVDRVTSELNDVLACSDYVVNVLPSTPDTVDLLSGDTLHNGCEKQPTFINVRMYE
jgi:phosphoglycerate dehydrogenase-like enzyme